MTISPAESDSTFSFQLPFLKNILVLSHLLVIFPLFIEPCVSSEGSGYTHLHFLASIQAIAET